jgi:hypothetical protein
VTIQRTVPETIELLAMGHHLDDLELNEDLSTDDPVYRAFWDELDDWEKQYYYWKGIVTFSALS